MYRDVLRKIVLEGWLYYILTHDCTYYVIVDKPLSAEELAKCYEKAYGKKVSEKEVERLREVLRVGQVDEELWQASPLSIVSLSLGDILEKIAGKHVRITIEILE